MPHSLRAKLSGLRYKKIISDKDYDRLCKALDNYDVLDKIRAEIGQIYTDEHIMFKKRLNSTYTCVRLDDVLQIIDKYRKEQTDENT